jgi:lipid-binding SYLF domain-containing protein
MKHLVMILALICFLPIHHAHAATRDEQRAEVQRMRTAVLDRLYRAQPGARDEIAKAVGYAVFSSADIAAIFFSGSYGHGVAHDNRDGSDTYMQMASAGIGLGVGVKDFRAVFVFDTPKAFQNFIRTGLDLSGNVDVSAKQGTKGAAVTGAQDVLPGVRVYQLTDTGLMAQAMLKGTKYWTDTSLNQHDTGKY